MFELRLGGEVDLTRDTNRLAALLHTSASDGQPLPGSSTTISATLRRFSAHLGLALDVPAGPGDFEPALHVGVDLLWARTTTLSSPAAAPTSADSLRITPTAEVRVGYRVALSHLMFVRPQLGLGFAILWYDLRQGPDGQPLFQTPTWFSTVGLEAGVVFR